jgi:beta-lactamase class C
MKGLRLLTSVLSLFSSWVLFAASSEQIQYEGLETFIQEWVDQKQVVGASVVVVKSGVVGFAKSYGVRKLGSKERVDLNTVFQLGSVTKTFTASLFATSALKNKMSLDAKLIAHKKGIHPDTRIKHLLSHSSGIESPGWNIKIESGYTRSQLFQSLIKLQQKKPGEVFSYNNFAYSLLEEEINATLGMPYSNAIQSFILNPLEMNRTTVGYEVFSRQENRAYPHVFTPKKRIEVRSRFSKNYHNTVVSSAGINSSGNDMGKFLSFLMGDYPQLASRKDLELFHTKVITAPDAKKWLKSHFQEPFGSYYGYGWRILQKGDDTIVFHGGWVGGFCNIIAIVPKKNIGIAILNNNENSFAMKTALYFLSEVLGSEWKTKMVLNKKK